MKRKSMRERVSRSRGGLWGLGASLLSSACGAGTALGLDATDQDDPPNNSPLVFDIGVSDAASSPATLAFRVSDPEGDDVRLRQEFQAPGGDFRALTLADRPNPDVFESSPDGVPHESAWDFAADLGSDDLHEGVMVRVVVLSGGPEKVAPAASEPTSPIFVGNARPSVVSVEPPAAPESSGITLVRFEVQDDNNDPVSTQEPQLVSVRAEFCVGEDCDDWRLATPAGLSGLGTADAQCAASDGAGEPCLTFVDLAAPRSGATVDFFWDVERDVGSLETVVRLRFLVDDGLSGFVEPTEDVVATLFVDNNDAPVAFLGQDELVVNSDQRRAIPVPFAVVDPESDPVHYVIQWAPEGEAFDDLAPSPGAGVDADLIEALSAGGADARALRVATERPLAFEGRLAALPTGEFDPKLQVRLPELASSAAGLLVREMGGLEIELLRSSPIPESIALSKSELSRPMDAFAIAEGLEAVVLDEIDADAFALHRVWLANGESAAPDDAMFGVAHAGTARALAVDRAHEVVFVASALGSSWSLHRFDFETGALLDVHHASTLATVHDVAALSSDVALVAVGTELLQVVFEDDGTARTTVLLGGGPFGGVAIDPFQPQHVFLSDTEGDRILEIQLNSLEASDLPLDDSLVELAGIAGIDAPRDLSVDPSGSRLLVVARDPSVLLEVALGTSIAAGGGESDGKLVAKQLIELDDAGASVMAGAGTLCVVAQEQPDTVGPDGDPADDAPCSGLLVGGGIEQRRVLASGVQDTAAARERQVITVTEPFDPVPAQNGRWRIQRRLLVADSSPEGTENVFLWDTAADLPKGGHVNLRIFPADTDVGAFDVGLGAKEVLPGLGFRSDEELVLVGTGAPVTDVAAGDLDGDGDVDLVAATPSGDELTVAEQKEPGSYSTCVLHDALDAPQAVAIGDIDCDGIPDVVCGEAGLDAENLFYFSGEVGEATAKLLGPPLNEEKAMEMAISAVALGDLDGDGDLDVAHSLTTPPPPPKDDQQDDDAHVRLLLSEGCQGGPPSFTESYIWDEFEAKHLDVVHHPSDLVIADLDADGDLDVALASLGDPDAAEASALKQSGNVLLFFQRAPDDFAIDPMLSILTGMGDAEGPRALTVADLDRDGFTDLASANQRSRNITVFLQDPNMPGSFESTDASVVVLEDVETIDPPLDLCAADVDRNGELDLISSNGDTIFDPPGNVTVYYQIEGAFEQPPLRLRNAEALEKPRAILATDADGDGDVDLITGNGLANTTLGGCKSGGGILVYPNTSPGTFALDSGSPFGQLGSEMAVMRSLVAADLDGDGDLDLASSNLGEGLRPPNLGLYRQLSPSSFEVDPQFVDSATKLDLKRPRGLEAVDVTGDGWVDLVVADREADRIVVLPQRGDGTFAFEGSMMLGGPEITDEPEAVAAADFDGDGRIDLASVNAGTEDVAVFLRESSGSFAPPLRLGGQGETDVAGTLAAGDLDGDGFADLVVGRTPVDTFDGNVELADLCPGDRNFNTSVGPPVVYRSTGAAGPGTFEPGLELPSGDLVFALRADALVLTDLNADGYLDVAVGGPDGLSLVTHSGVDLDFALGLTFDDLVVADDECFGPLSLNTGDLDGDGDLDLVADNTRRIHAYYQLGPGIFDPNGVVLADENELQAVEFIQSVLVADLDGDGEVDVANTNAGDSTHTVNVFFNGH